MQNKKQNGEKQMVHSAVSLPFEAGEDRKVAVKIVDDWGIESLKVISLE